MKKKQTCHQKPLHVKYANRAHDGDLTSCLYTYDYNRFKTQKYWFKLWLFVSTDKNHQRKSEEEEENGSSLTSKKQDSGDKVHDSNRTSVDLSNQWKSREKQTTRVETGVNPRCIQRGTKLSEGVDHWPAPHFVLTATKTKLERRRRKETDNAMAAVWSRKRRSVVEQLVLSLWVTQHCRHW